MHIMITQFYLNGYLFINSVYQHSTDIFLAFLSLSFIPSQTSLHKTMKDIKVKHGFRGKSVNMKKTEMKGKSHLDSAIGFKSTSAGDMEAMVEMEGDEVYSDGTQSGSRNYHDHDNEDYKDHLYKLLCKVFIDIYRILITKLSSNDFLSIPRNQEKDNHSNSASQHPLTLLQAVEELEFIKVNRRDIIINDDDDDYFMISLMMMMMFSLIKYITRVTKSNLHIMEIRFCTPHAVIYLGQHRHHYE